MLHPIVKGRSALRDAVHAVREWLHPGAAVKGAAPQPPLDDLSQRAEDVERREAAKGPATSVQRH